MEPFNQTLVTGSTTPGAEVNNISDANATDLTDGGDSSLHYHSADRNRANHTGTQTLSTISDAGTIASQDANSVNITGGSVTGITDLAIADGGTGAGTASGARTNLDVYSTGEVDEYLNQKATAGGVRFSTGGQIVISDNATTETAFRQDSNVLTYSWVGNASQQTFRQYVYIKSESSIASTGGGFEIYHQENTTNLIVLLRQFGSNSGHYGVRWDNIIDGTLKHYVLKFDYTGASPVVTLAVNGADAGTGTVIVSVSGTFDDSNALYVRIGAQDSTRYYGGSLRDFTIFNRALTATEVADLYRNGLAGIADADRWGVPGTSTGCIAAYPMNEGIGYQLHDISSNHYDGLLSTSGFTHLVPKTEGYIRDFNVDAYNGGSGIIQLIDSTQDILPADSVITRASFTNQGTGAVSGSLYLYRISSGGVSDQIDNFSLALSAGADLYMNSFPIDGVEQIKTYNEVGIRSFDTDATALDVRIEYKKLK